MDLGAEAARLGIEVDYVDARGRRRTVLPAGLQQNGRAVGPRGAQGPAEPARPGGGPAAGRPQAAVPAGGLSALPAGCAAGAARPVRGFPAGPQPVAGTLCELRGAPPPARGPVVGMARQVAKAERRRLAATA